MQALQHLLSLVATTLLLAVALLTMAGATALRDRLARIFAAALAASVFLPPLAAALLAAAGEVLRDTRLSVGNGPVLTPGLAAAVVAGHLVLAAVLLRRRLGAEARRRRTADRERDRFRERERVPASGEEDAP